MSVRRLLDISTFYVDIRSSSNNTALTLWLYLFLFDLAFSELMGILLHIFPSLRILPIFFQIIAASPSSFIPMFPQRMNHEAIVLKSYIFHKNPPWGFPKTRFQIIRFSHFPEKICCINHFYYLRLYAKTKFNIFEF